jgi:hypothetical protein
MGTVYDDLDGDQRVVLVDLPQEVREPGVDNRVRDAELHRSRKSARPGNRQHHLGSQAQHPFRILQQNTALGGKVTAALVAFEQTDLELLLELGDARRDRGLRHMQLLGGSVKASRMSHDAEDFQTSEIDHPSVESFPGN